MEKNFFAFLDDSDHVCLFFFLNPSLSSSNLEPPSGRLELRSSRVEPPRGRVEPGSSRWSFPYCFFSNVLLEHGGNSKSLLLFEFVY